MRISFTITAKESETASDWIKNHKCAQRGHYPGPIGGTISFCFTETTIGTIVVVKCGCGQELNLTDFSNW